jgi:hypothetical protein
MNRYFICVIDFLLCCVAIILFLIATSDGPYFPILNFVCCLCLYVGACLWLRSGNSSRRGKEVRS